MIIIDNKVVSTDIEKEFFVCDLHRCKGACCVEGDLGAPLGEDELDQIDKIIEVVKPYLPNEAIEVLEKDGGYIIDEEGDFSTATIGGKECVFAYRDGNAILKCSIEQAWEDGKSDFQKPISCHLYPIRIAKLDEYEALNYDRWHICSPACELGNQLKLPLYQFLKEALIRKYGEKWYDELVAQIQNGTEPD